MKALAYNVAALDKVLGLATQVGDSYKPGNTSIERTALTALLEESRKSVTAVLKAETDLMSAINARQNAFGKLSLLGTQIMGLAEAGGMDDKDLQDLNLLRKRFSQIRAKATPQSEGATVNRDTVPSAETSVRRNRNLSYDSRVVTLESIIKFLEEKPSYNPTEPEFTIDALKEKLAMLQSLTQAVNNASSELIKARINARFMVFDRKSGILGRARMTKRYLRSILGTDAELFKAISKVKFKIG